MKYIRSFIYLAFCFIIASTQQPLQATSHASQTPHANFAQFFGSLCTSTVLSSCIGGLSGYFAKVAHEEAEKSNNKKLGWLACWILSPAIRIALLLEITKQAHTYNMPLNWIYTQSLAQIVDWLVYFDKIKIGGSKNEEKTVFFLPQKTMPSAPLYSQDMNYETYNQNSNTY
jgi:hypothetical protein